MRDAFKLSDEYAAKWTPQGDLYIFSYFDDDGEIRKRINANHLTLGETELRALAAETCAAFGGCDELKDATVERADLLAALEAIVEAVDDEWQGPPFSEPMLTDRDHALLEQANAAIEQARAAQAGPPPGGAGRERCE